MLIKKGGSNHLSPSGGQLAAPRSPARGYGGASPYASPLPARASPVPPPLGLQADPGQAGRLDALERRLAAIESNNRSMLNQFTQLQQETMVSLRRDAHGASEQRDSRGRMETALRGIQQKLGEVDHRVGRSSSTLRDTQSSIQSLAIQTNNLRNSLAASGHESEQMALARLQESRQEIVDLLQYHDSARKEANMLREDTQNMRIKVETLHGDLQALSHSARLQEELFEEETRRTLRGGEGGGRPAATTTAALEGRVARLQSSLRDAESRLAHEANKDGIAQQRQNEKIAALQEEVARCSRQGQQEFQDLQTSQDADPATGRMQQDVDRMRSRLDQKLSDSRSSSSGAEERELKDQLKNLQQNMRKEVTNRTERETQLKAEVEKKLAEISAYSDEGFGSVRKLNEEEHGQTKRRFRELAERLDVLEKKREGDQEELENLLDKQRQARRKLDREMDDRLDDVGDRLRIAMASLVAAQSELPPGQQGAPGQLSMEEIERLQNMESSGAREQLTRALADTELKLSELSTRVEQQDEVIENKLRMVEKSDSNELGVIGDDLTRKIDSVTFTQERLKRRIDNLDSQVKESPEEVNAIQERLDVLERETLQKLEREDIRRREEVEELGKDVRGKVEQEENRVAELTRLERNVDESQVSVTKLSEAMQTINRVIGGKIKEGKRTREQETIDLKRNIDRLYDQNRDLKDRIKHPRDYL